MALKAPDVFDLASRVDGSIQILNDGGHRLCQGRDASDAGEVNFLGSCLFQQLAKRHHRKELDTAARPKRRKPESTL
jgi:hypothetical protein